jgi:hypothetical protein
MGVPGVVNTGSFQTGLNFQQGQPTYSQATRPFQSMNGQSTGANQPVSAGYFSGQPQNYQPMFNSNGQVTGQTGSFQSIPQNQAMETDDHGVPGFLRRKKG